MLTKLKDDKTGRDKRLLLWYFESLLKISYNNFIKAIQVYFLKIQKQFKNNTFNQ